MLKNFPARNPPSWIPVLDDPSSTYLSTYLDACSDVCACDLELIRFNCAPHRSIDKTIIFSAFLEPNRTNQIEISQGRLLSPTQTTQLSLAGFKQH